MKPNIRKYWFTTGEMGTLMATGEVVGGIFVGIHPRTASRREGKKVARY